MRQFPFQTLICFCCNQLDAKHGYVFLMMRTSLNMTKYKNSQSNRSHANDSYGSNRPMMRGFSKGVYRNRKPTFLEQIYTVEVVATR